MIKVLDNFLEKKDFQNLKKNILDNHNFPWYLSLGINNKENARQFYHYFYKDDNVCSNYISLLEPILNKLESNTLVRIKLNLLPKSFSILEYKYHTDILFKNDVFCKTAIFYLNSNNGHTLFKNFNSIQSTENRLVSFNSNIEHGGTTCTDQDFRYVLNLNYF